MKNCASSIPRDLPSRPKLKIANDKVQTLLEKWVHPMYAFGHVNKPKTYLDVANKYLLFYLFHC